MRLSAERFALMSIEFYRVTSEHELIQMCEVSEQLVILWIGPFQSLSTLSYHEELAILHLHEALQPTNGGSDLFNVVQIDSSGAFDGDLRLFSQAGVHWNSWRRAYMSLSV